MMWRAAAMMNDADLESLSPGLPPRNAATAIKCDKDPGYGSTSKMISESALCLCKDVNLQGGFFTPAAAFGDKLISRLEEKAGLTFAIEK